MAPCRGRRKAKLEKMKGKNFRGRTYLNALVSLLIFGPVLLGNGECNTFIGAADKSSDDALIYDVQQKINAGDYDGALDLIGRLSPGRRESYDGRVLEATALAGKCGLDFIRMAKDIVEGIGSKQLMKILGSNMRNATDFTPCVQAETVLMGIQANQMTPDDHIFLAFVEFAKMGAILAESGAIDASGNVVPTYDPCTDLDDHQAGHIGTAINIAVDAIAASGVSVAGATTAIVEELCEEIGTLPIPGDINPCGIKDPSAFTVEQRLMIRSVVQSNEIGLNTCGGSITNPGCICPP